MGSSKKQTIGHKILWGMHAVLSCGPIDKITRIIFDGKTGWSGSSEGGRIDVDAEGLFGGEKREGGVSGAIDFENGEPTQDKNDYLQARLGSMISGFRGVAALVFRQTYWGLNPYMKPVMVRAQRIHRRHREGIEQWYDEKAQIGGGGIVYPPEWEATQTIWAGGISVEDLAYCGDDNWIAVGDAGRVSTSSGNALGWDAFQTILGGVDINSVHSHDGVTLAVGGTGRVSRSTDCGATWSAYQSIAGTSGTGYPGLRSVHYGNGAWVVGADNARLQRSLDGGLTWDLSAFNAVSGLSGSCRARWIDTVWIAWSSTASTVFRSTDNAATWSSAITVTGVPHPIIEIKSGNGVTIAISGNSGYMARSLDYGLTWGTAFIPLPSGAGGVTSLLSLDYHDGVWLMAGLRDATGFVARSDDDGATWTEVFPEIGIRTTSMNYANGVWVMSGWAGAVKRLVLTGSADPGCPAMNPAHMIREINTDPDNGLGYPEDDIDPVSFTSAADTLYAEGFGLSAFWEDSKRLHEFRSEILRHIDAAHYIDRRTGKFVLKLIRPDYAPDALPVLDESVVERVENFSRPKPDEAVNTVHVRFWDCATGNNNAMAYADDPALIQIQGGVIAQTIDYPWIPNYELAGRVAERDLRGLSLPLATCTIYATSAAADLHEGAAFKLQWPDTGVAQIIMRVTHIAFGNGRSSRVRIQAVEDRFSMPATPIQVAPPPLWENPSQPPAPVDYQITVEAPYYEIVQQLGQSNADNQLALNEFAGFLVTTGAQPGNAINASVAVDAGTGYETTGVIDFCPFAVLDEDIGPTATVIAIRDGIDLDNVTIGTHAQIGDELVRIDAVSETELTIGRGVLDTVPATLHADGTKIFFWDEYAPGGDETEYAASAELDVKLLPINGSGSVVLGDATAQQITFDQRAVRPYPPGAFKIDAIAYPAGIEPSATTTISWAHRDRLQQTAGTIEDTTAASIGPEAGTTYTVEIRDASDDTLIDSDTAVAGTSAVFDTSAVAADALKILLWSVRDGLDSWQVHEWVVATTAGRVTEADDDRITEDGNFRILD